MTISIGYDIQNKVTWCISWSPASSAIPRGEWSNSNRSTHKDIVLFNTA